MNQKQSDEPSGLEIILGLLLLMLVGYIYLAPSELLQVFFKFSLLGRFHSEE